MPTSTPKRQPRLKESCDRCSIAKVRCNKDKPACSRCAQKGLPCGYSFSRRAGRRTTSSLSSMAAMLERSDSRASSPHMSHSLSPSLASLSPHLGASPADMSDDSDIFPDMWSFPPTTQPTHIPSSMPQQFGWDQDLYSMTSNAFEQPFTFPASVHADHQSFDHPMDMATTLLPPPLYPHNNTPTSTPPPPMLNHHHTLTSEMHRTSSLSSSSESSSSQADAVQDELANLTDFATAMEKKFDAVVRQRMQYRDVYSDFGVPVDDMDLSNPEAFAKMRQDWAQQADGAVMPEPDLSEMSMYFSLAELKRRLTWLREDVGNLVVQG